jgi:hypothetical protein
MIHRHLDVSLWHKELYSGLVFEASCDMQICKRSGFYLECDGHLLLYTLSHIELSGNAPVRPGYNELTLQLATAACHVQRPNRNYLTWTSIKLQNYGVVHMSGKYLRMCCKPCYA